MRRIFLTGVVVLALAAPAMAGQQSAGIQVSVTVVPGPVASHRPRSAAIAALPPRDDTRETIYPTTEPR